jgi:hypothetical protein
MSLAGGPACGAARAPEELAVAMTWLAARPQYAPEPTVVHREFIKTGEAAAVGRATSI